MSAKRKQFGFNVAVNGKSHKLIIKERRRLKKVVLYHHKSVHSTEDQQGREHNR